MALIRLGEGSAGRVFEGERIAGGPGQRAWSRYDGAGQHPRWTELELYRREGGQYVLYVASISRVWHLPGAAHIRRPAGMAREDLPPDAVYCGSLPQRPGRAYCRLVPSGALGLFTAPLPERVLAEQPRFRITSCPDAQAVARQLALETPGGVSWSRPAQELLAQAAAADPAFAELAAR